VDTGGLSGIIILYTEDTIDTGSVLSVVSVRHRRVNRMWRPKDWENPYEYKDLIGDCQRTAFEAGADAMLGALRKQPRVKYQNYAVLNPNFPFPATYYLIPDEEDTNVGH